MALTAGGYLFQSFVDRVELTPADAVRHYLEAVDDEDFERAHGQLCAEMQRTHPPRRLRGTMEELLDEIGGELGAWTIDEFPYPRGPDRYGIYFEARGVRLSPRRYQVTVVREGDAWRLCGLER